MNLNKLNIYPNEQGFYLGINMRGCGLLYFHICNNIPTWMTSNIGKNIDIYELNKEKSSSFSLFNSTIQLDQRDYRWINMKINHQEKIHCKICKEGSK